jgi:hypothetical protein
MKKLHFFILIVLSSALCAQAQKSHKFIRVGDGLGIDSHNPGNASPEGSLGHAVAWGDIDDDGKLDIAFSNQGDEVNGLHFWLYRNTEAGFVDISEAAGLGGLYADKILFADLNGDYYPELIVFKQPMSFPPYNPWEQTIYKNNGDLTFTKQTSTGVNYKVHATADFNKDGLVDLLAWNNSGTLIIYTNNGDFDFTASTIGSAVDVYAVSCIDFNNDTYPDFYTSSFGENPNYLYKNNGDGTFTDVTNEAGVGYNYAGHGVTIGDMNNDGYQDIYVGAYNQSLSCKLFKNNGDGTFSDITSSSGTFGYTDTRTSSFGDYNNDGFLDIFSSHHQFWVDQSILYHNVQNETFFDASVPMALSYEIIDEEWMGDYFGAAWGDFNNDGDRDIFTAGHIQYDHYNLWKNSGNPRNSIILNLKGVASNKSAIGAKAVLNTGTKLIYRTVNPAQGQRDGHSMRLHFGLDYEIDFENITIYWPSGLGQTIEFADFTINAVNTVVEGEGVTDIYGEIIYVDVSEITDYNDVSIYPNPSNGIFRIENNSTFNIHNSTIIITDIAGRIVYSTNNPRDRIDLSYLGKGVYFMSINTSKDNHIEKVIIR